MTRWCNCRRQNRISFIRFFPSLLAPPLIFFYLLLFFPPFFSLSLSRSLLTCFLVFDFVVFFFAYVREWVRKCVFYSIESFFKNFSFAINFNFENFKFKNVLAVNKLILSYNIIVVVESAAVAAAAAAAVALNPKNYLFFPY